MGGQVLSGNPINTGETTNATLLVLGAVFNVGIEQGGVGLKQGALGIRRKNTVKSVRLVGTDLKHSLLGSQYTIRGNTATERSVRVSSVTRGVGRSSISELIKSSNGGETNTGINNGIGNA